MIMMVPVVMGRVRTISPGYKWETKEQDGELSGQKPLLVSAVPVINCF